MSRDVGAARAADGRQRAAGAARAGRHGLQRLRQRERAVDQPAGRVADGSATLSVASPAVEMTLAVVLGRVRLGDARRERAELGGRAGGNSPTVAGHAAAQQLQPLHSLGAGAALWLPLITHPAGPSPSLDLAPAVAQPAPCGQPLAMATHRVAQVPRGLPCALMCVWSSLAQ